jgi:nucleotide-binding universal stress UspA family protein
MSDDGGGSYRLVVGVDFSEESEFALDCALRFAAPHEGAEVHMVHVLATGAGSTWTEGTAWPPPSESPDDWSLYQATLTHLESYGDIRRGQLAQRGTRFPRERIISHLKRGKPAEELVQLANELDVALLVVGTHGRRGLRRLILGSVAEEVVRTAPCPVFVARRKVRTIEDRPTHPSASDDNRGDGIHAS